MQKIQEEYINQINAEETNLFKKQIICLVSDKTR